MKKRITFGITILFLFMALTFVSAQSTSFDDIYKINQSSCSQKTIYNQGTGVNFLSFDCGSNKVVGTVQSVDCSSGIPYVSGMAYLSNDWTGLPSQVSYSCKSQIDNKITAPSSITSQCCSNPQIESSQKTIYNQGTGVNFLSFDCGSNKVVGTVQSVDCSSGIPYVSGMAYLSNDWTGLPSQVSYSCKSQIDNKITAPSSITSQCLSTSIKTIIISPNETTGPIDIPESNVTETTPESNVTETTPEVVCNGCALDKKCYPFGYRIESEYCADNGNFSTQKEAGLSCDNSFECSTNLCVDNECISSGFWQAIMNFFKKIFG